MYRCALCGKSMRLPAVTIGGLPIGPTCSRKAGLLEPAKKRRGVVRIFAGQVPQRREDTQTIDMFEGVAA